MIPSLRKTSYKEHLKDLNLFPLTQRRLIGDLIQVFKILRNIDNIDCDKYFKVHQTNYTRGHGYKIRKHVNSHEAMNFFSTESLAHGMDSAQTS